MLGGGDTVGDTVVVVVVGVGATEVLATTVLALLNSCVVSPTATVGGRTCILSLGGSLKRSLDLGASARGAAGRTDLGATAVACFRVGRTLGR